MDSSREDRRFAGRTIAVTGASRGLGAALSRRLADEGATVAMLARPSDHRDAVAREIGTAGLAIDCNVADPHSVDAAFAAIRLHAGRLDALVNNAALAVPHLIVEATDDEIALEIGANLLGPIHCIRAAAPLLRDAGGGDIVNISSVSVNSIFPTLGLYAATKAALETLTEALATELKPDNVRLSVFRVGAIAGDSFGRNWTPERRAQAMALAAAAGRGGQTGTPVAAETIAGAIADLIALAPTVRVPIVEFRPR